MNNQIKSVFVLQVEGWKRIKYIVCFIIKNGKVSKKNRYGIKYEDGCMIYFSGFGVGSEFDVNFVYIR